MFILLLPLVVFVIGLLIGSFLNVVILRLNTGRSMVTGRSKCARCSRELTWYELIPVASFLALRGKCRTCRQHISHQYPIVELITAITFMVLYSSIVIPAGITTISILTFLFAATVGALLIVILIYDMRHKIIPDSVVYPFIILSFVSIIWNVFFTPGFSVSSAIFGGILVALPFFLLWYFSRGTMMGFGDVKLALGMGWLLGLSGGFAALVLAFWIGGIVGLVLLAATRQYKMKSQIPFAPFLIAGIAIVGIWHVTMSTLFPLWP